MSDFDPYNAGNLTARFDALRKLPSAELLEDLRRDYYIDATMKGSSDPVIGGLRVDMSGRTDTDYSGSDAKKKRERDERMFALMIHNMTIQQIEEQLAARYGENFAENLAAEYLNEETYKRLMGIDDKTERRRQIALELNKGIQDGSIDADIILGNSDFEGWLHAHDTEEQRRILKQMQVPSRPDMQTAAQVTDDSKIEDHHGKRHNVALESGFDKILGR